MLSPKAEQLMQNYFNLPFPGVDNVRCPYFNNTKLKQRGQLRVLVGKGTPAEIVEEAKIISIQYHAGLFDKAGHCCLHGEHGDNKILAEDIRKFLINNNLGIDCSGFVSQVLYQHFLETAHVKLFKKMFIVAPTNFLRWLISQLRPIENISVKHYADNRNTEIITKIDQIKPADLIVMLETGPRNNRNHIVLITDHTDDVIKYAAARAWTSDGQYGHGVTKGEIRIMKPKGSLLDQEWIESDKKNLENETYLEAKNAKILEIRRIKL